MPGLDSLCFGKMKENHFFYWHDAAPFARRNGKKKRKSPQERSRASAIGTDPFGAAPSPE
jgi:hypothetical protein